MTLHHGLGTYGNAVGTVTPTDHKNDQAGLISKLRLGTNAVHAGLFWDGTTNILTGAANMSYNIAPFSAVLSRGATSGAILINNDATFNIATTAAPGSNSRYDIVYVWQREFSIDGTDSEPVFGIIQGTASATPTVPSLAAFPGAIPLAQILVPSGVTATNTGTTIAQLYTLTTVDGAVIVGPDSATRDRTFPSPRQGDYYHNLGLGWEERYSAVYNASTNPGGAKTAGWYPSGRGVVPRISAIGGITAYGAGSTAIIGQVNYMSFDQPILGFATPITNGTGVGFRIVVPTGMEGIYELEASGVFDSGPVNLFVKRNDPDSSITNVLAMDSGTGQGSFNARIIHQNVTLAAADYLLLAFSAQTSGSIALTGLRISLTWKRTRQV